jgi:hypothetical protein
LGFVFTRNEQSNTLHIGTHILSKSSKDNTQNPNQTHYQLTSHLQSNTLTYKFKPSTAPAESGLIHLVSQGARYLAP